MFFNLKMSLALVGPLFSQINLVALICLLIFVNAGSTGKLPIKSDNNNSNSSSSSTPVGLSATHNSIIEINLGLNKHQTEKVPVQSNVVISCNIEHLQGWYKNNENMNVEMKSLTFKPIKKIDSGTYGCKSTDNIWSNVTLSVISLKHHNKTTGGGSGSSNSGESSKKLRFVNTSAMHSLMKKNVGESVQFNCAVDDPAKTLNSKLTWTKNGKPLNRSAPLYFTKTSLQIEDLRTDDAGQYTCHICNVNSCINFTTTLDVLETGDDTKMDRYIDNLVVDADGLNNDKNDNDGITNDDDDEDLYLEPEFREHKNKTSLAEPNNYLSETQKVVANHTGDSNTDSLLGGHEEDDDNQNNKTDDGDHDSIDDEEEKGMKPYFSKPESMEPLIAKPSGNMVRLSCNVKGHPEPTITWTKDYKEIQRLMGAAKYRKFALILEDLVPSDSGYYRCRACNEHGCIEHLTKVYVNERFPARPYVKEGFPKNVTVLLNDTAVFECPTVSDLAAHIEWAKFRAENNNDTKVPVNVQKFQTDSENPEILRLDNVTFDDEGWYTCYAANSLGTSAASAYLQVVAELPIDPIKLPIRGLPVWLLILIIILTSSFLCAMAVMWFIFKKLQIEKQNKNLNLEKVNMVTKKIIIVKPNSYNTNNGGTQETISFPIVKIEKHRSVMLQNSNCEQSFESEYEFPIDEDWEIARSKLALGRPLGEGEFGRVMMAEARDLFKPGSKTIVAVKMLKDGHTDQDVSDLVSEMELMKMIGKHINIINLLGCCTQDGPLHVIVEYAPHGNLRDFLKSNRLSHDNSDPSIQKKCFTEKELVSYAYQAARGMEYLASRRCVHRDLAARNVLVGEDYIIKIADFGLARDIHAQDYYRKNSDGRLPIKWMAPESLMYKKYDSKSDVWSYGILLWEIMSLGATPYPYMAKYTKMITTLQSGYRMEKPEYCSMDIYTLMRECWNFRPDQRPNFSEIVKDLDQILSRTSDKEYLDLGLPELETPPSSENESDTDTEEL